jgi:hypothetical protein
MEHDFASYQSPETVWRYSFRITQLQEEIQRAEQRLVECKERLAELESHPPLIHLFNWSA